MTAAAFLVLLLLYLLGWAATRVIGRHVIRHFEGIIARVPFVNTIYLNVKKLLVVVGDNLMAASVSCSSISLPPK